MQLAPSTHALDQHLLIDHTMVEGQIQEAMEVVDMVQTLNLPIICQNTNTEMKIMLMIKRANDAR